MRLCFSIVPLALGLVVAIGCADDGSVRNPPRDAGLNRDAELSDGTGSDARADTRQRAGDSGSDVPVPATARGRWHVVPGPGPSGSRLTATVLAGGDEVLVVGGENYFDGQRRRSDQAWIYRRSDDRFIPAGRLRTARSRHSATLLPDGTVLVVGGVGPDSEPIASTEIYDPKQPTELAWRVGPEMVGGTRADHAAVRLEDGRVLVIGGTGSAPGDSVASYNWQASADKRWEVLTAPMVETRQGHRAVLLQSGQILVVGGEGRDSAEVFEPARGVFTKLEGTLSGDKAHMSVTTYNDRSGRQKVLVAGGTNIDHIKRDILALRGEIFDPTLGTMTPISHTEGTPQRHAATLLRDGRVLIIGGGLFGDDREVSNTTPAVLPRAVAFDPHASPPAWRELSAPHIGRQDHVAVTLADGSVLVVGGHKHQASIDWAERFSPTETPQQPATPPTVRWTTMQIDSEAWIEDIWGSSPRNVYLISQDRGKLFHYDGNADNTWTAVEVDDRTYFASIWGRGPDDIYAVGRSRAIWHYDGREWDKADLSDLAISRSSFKAVWGTASRVYVGASTGRTILVHDGSRWRSVEPGLSSDRTIEAISGTSDSDVYAVAATGTVVHFDGRQWAIDTVNARWNFTGIWSSSSTAFATHALGVIFRREQPGGWSQMGTNSNRAIRDLWGNDKDDVFAVGNEGTLLHYAGNGCCWSPVAIPTDETLTAVWLHGDDIFVAGDDGLVLRGIRQ